MKLRWISGVLVAGVVIGVWALGRVPAQEGGRRPARERDGRSEPARPERSNDSTSGPATRSRAEANAFEGKLVALSLADAKQPTLLEQARFEQIHGRTFLVGRSVKATLNFSLGADTHLAWDSVQAFYLFDNVEQYEAAIEEAMHEAFGAVNGVFGKLLNGSDNAPLATEGRPAFVASPGESASPNWTYEESPDGRIIRRASINRVVRDDDGSERVVVEEKVEEVRPSRSRGTQRAEAADEDQTP